MASPGCHDVHEGAEIAPRQYQVTRRDLVRYAGASGDFNPIHWNQRIATSVGLPDVIAPTACSRWRWRAGTSPNGPGTRPR
jgi:Acyl dehydratase